MGAAKVLRMGVGGSNGRSKSAGDRSFKIAIPSVFEEGRDVQKRILDNVISLHYSEQSQFAIKLAIEEALMNAIKHGNREDPKKKVHIEVKISAKRLEVTIEDEGSGFKPHAVPDPTLDENLQKCSGRGILLMEAYMDRVQYSRGGRRLKIVKKNEEDVVPAR